jgi:TPR repeat protein
MDFSFSLFLSLNQKAALGGIAPALHNIANFYAEGKGTEINLQTAFAYYSAAVECEDPYACFTLGTWYQHGRDGVLAQNKPRALELYKKAAEMSHPVAMFNVGVAYLLADQEAGITTPNFQEAEKWLRKAHETKMVPYATINLTKMFMDGYGVEKNLDEAKKIIEELANQGNEVAKELSEEIEIRRKEESSSSSVS